MELFVTIKEENENNGSYQNQFSGNDCLNELRSWIKNVFSSSIHNDKIYILNIFKSETCCFDIQHPSKINKFTVKNSEIINI